jgi:hypothetical protein
MQRTHGGNKPYRFPPIFLLRQRLPKLLYGFYNFHDEFTELQNLQVKKSL